MSIANAINNARNKINNAYNALENKGAQIPDVKDLQHLPDTINSVSEFSSEFANWKYSGRWGQLYLNGTYVDSTRQHIIVPSINNTYLTSTTFKNITRPDDPNKEAQDGTANSANYLLSVDCSNVPFINAVGAFKGCTNLRLAQNTGLVDILEYSPYVPPETNYSSVNEMFYDCHELASIQMVLPSTVKTAVGMFRNCKNCSDFYIDAPGFTTMTDTFAYCDAKPINVTLTSPYITNVSGQYTNYNMYCNKNIYIYYTFDGQGNYTNTFNAHKGAEYMGTTSNNTSYYIQPRYNKTTKFYIYDLSRYPTVFGDYRIDDTSTSNPSISVLENSKQSYSSIGLEANFRKYPLDTVNTVIPITNLSNTFRDCKMLTVNMSIPNTVVNMTNTFCGCVGLNQNIQIPNSVTSMVYTFYDCNKLNQDIRIPNSVTNIFGVFYNCTGLNQNIQIPNSITNMDRAFWNCRSLDKDIRIPNTVSTLYYTFSDCISLNQDIQIPNSVESIQGTFYGCRALDKNIQIPNSVSNMSSTFYSCISLNQDIQIPNSVSNMSGTFSYCTNLNQSIQVPDSVTDMYSAFSGCVNLGQNITVLSNKVARANRCFDMTEIPKDVYIPYNYENGERSVTFNSFVVAGYLTSAGVSTGQNGVTMHDLDLTLTGQTNEEEKQND